MKGATGIRKIWLWVFLTIFVLFLLSSNIRKRPAWGPAGQLIIEITAPFQKLAKNTIGLVEEFWFNYFYLINARRENRTLKAEIDVLRMENSRYRELLITLDRLQELLQFRQTIKRPVLAAQVTGRDPTGWFKSVIIDKGSSEGLKLDLPVVNSLGVVGRVVSVSPNFAKVLLIIDQNSSVDCLIQRSRSRGMVKGLSAGICKLSYMVKSGDLVAGDMVVTSGLGGIFPKGLPVGIVLRVDEHPGELFKEVIIGPEVDFSKLEEVLVILGEERSNQ